MSEIIVSIPILAYNHEKFIKQALEGVLVQKTNFEYEIIIAEDCSTDNTLGIINSFALKHPKKIKIITSDTNVGAIENAKRAVNACKGKYLAFCEGDDCWTDLNKLQKQVDFLEANPEYGMVHTDVNHFLEKKGVLIKNFNKNNKINFPSGNIFKEYLKGDLFIKTATVIVRRDLFLRASNYKLFSQKKWVLQDLPTWLEIAFQSKIKYFPITTATYRLGNETASRTKDRQSHHQFHLSVFDIRYFFWKKYSNDLVVKEILDQSYLKMLMHNILTTRDKKLLTYIVELFREKISHIKNKDKTRLLFKLLILKTQQVFFK